MRVCYLINAFYPVVGGGETHARLLCSEMNRQGADVFVITRRTTRALQREEVIGGVKVYRVPPTGSGRFQKYLMLFPLFFRLILMNKEYDVIIVSGLRLLGVPAVFAAKMFRKKCVLRGSSCGEFSGAFIWDSPHLEQKRKPSMLFKMLIAVRNRLLLKADGFLGISEVIADEYRDCNVPECKIEMIYNGTDTERYIPLDAECKKKLRARLNIGQKTIFAYSGKLNKGKGLEFLLQIWKKLIAEHTDLHLLLIGSGKGSFLSCENKLRDYVMQNDLSSSVTFTGYVDNVHEYLQCSDYFVFPSLNEAAPNAVIEALACGLPCFGTDVGGIPDSVKDGMNGRLLPAEDEDAWLTAINDALRDEKQSSGWKEQGRAHVLQRNSMKNVAKKHLDFLNRI